MEPSQKAPVLDALLQAVTGNSREDSVRGSKCVICGKPITESEYAKGSGKPFRDAGSEKEYTLSGMCQDDQDAVFGSPEEQDNELWEGDVIGNPFEGNKMEPPF